MPIPSSIFRLVQDAEPNRVDLELIGQFVHRRLGRVESGHRARARACQTASRCCAGRDRMSRAGSARCSGTASPRRNLRDSCRASTVVDVIVLERDELALRRGAEPHTLLSARTMTDRLEHHLAADHELHRLAELPRRRRGQAGNASMARACCRNPSRRTW